MSDTDTVSFVNTSDNYFYPNTHSFDALRTGRGRRQLYRGTIWAMDQRTVDVGAGYSTGTYERTINAAYYKKFQFNPADVGMAMAAVATDVPSTQDSGGNLPTVGQGMGSLSFSLQLQFVRDQEVYAATMGMGMPEVTPIAQDLAVYARVGVQKDIYDLYRVIMASDVDEVRSEDSAYMTQTLPTDVTLSGLTKKAFDLASAGSFLLQRPVAVQLNRDMILFGFITSLNVQYVKFNFNMVPTWAKVAMGLDVTNVRPSSAPPSTFAWDLPNMGGGGSGGNGGGGSDNPANPSVTPRGGTVGKAS